MISAYEARQRTLEVHIYTNEIIQVERSIESAIQRGEYSTIFHMSNTTNQIAMKIYNYLVQHGYVVTIEFKQMLTRYGIERELNVWVFTIQWGTDGDFNERNETLSV